MTLPNGDLQTIVEKLKELRKHTPLWQLARDIGISQGTLSQIINERRDIPEPGYVEQKLRDFIAKLKQKDQIKSTK